MEQGRSDLPEKLAELFKAADTALFDLHHGMYRTMQALPGKELWREVFAARVRIAQELRPMVENNYKPVVIEERRESPPESKAGPFDDDGEDDPRWSCSKD